GRFDETRPYFVMEYVDGIPLEKIIHKIPLDKAKAVAVTLARALAYLHRNDIIHPALRSSEIIIIDSVTHAKLIDFGPARVSCHRNGTYSVNGIISGNLSSFAPEIILLRENTKASNVYSLAAVVTEMFTGQRLFGTFSTPIDLASKIIGDPAQSLTELRPDLDFPKPVVEILKECLEKDPENRPSMADLLAVFNRAWPEY
ncbi:MAG: protein kinase, partial [Candidatus Obscuribacterales bacterium]|nr:protein kinase [Candidatus Obscuribacterales bacterium]